jgi:hypothetical protein
LYTIASHGRQSIHIAVQKRDDRLTLKQSTQQILRHHSEVAMMHRLKPLIMIAIAAWLALFQI